MHKQLIEKAIKESGLSNKAFAKALGVSRGCLYSWKNSGIVPEKKRGALCDLAKNTITPEQFSIYSKNLNDENS
tara:strand:- start:672 stop:893 length:222 start_codon:yes stop_codon:yes gene_type:complete